MTGRNRFPRGRSVDAILKRRKTAHAEKGTCVFISHRSVDKHIARQLTSILAELGIDYYFDEEDLGLQLAQRVGDHQAIVYCIEDGLANSTHLVGIITPKTRGSWWVPFEIGASRAHAVGKGVVDPSIQTAYLIDQAVQEVPEYMRSSTLIESEPALREWLARLSFDLWFADSMVKQASAGRLSNFLSYNKRSLSFTR